MRKKFDFLSGHFVSVTLLVLLGASMRIIPHPDNFTPLTGIALFAGAQLLNPFAALAVAMGSLLLSDLFLGFYSIMPVVYGAFGLMILVGRKLGPNPSLFWVTMAALGSGLLFFMLTNFAVWAFEDMYPKTLAGLTQCFTMAIPFYRATIAGDLIFSLGLFTLVKILKFVPARARLQA